MLQNQNTRKLTWLTSLALVMLAIIVPGQTFAFNNPPERCAGLGDLQSFSLTNWDNGLLTPWTANRHDLASPDDFITPDWAVVGSLPDGRLGKAAFVANKELLDFCDLFVQPGVLNLDSPPIIIPGGVLVPRISIDHLFVIDYLWDGGNFKISVNGGSFNLIPASAIEFGSYADTLYPAFTQGGSPFNENPLAGEDAFTGPDQPGGNNDDLSSGWGQSHINLLGIAAAGDTIELRFDFGIDECGGGEIAEFATIDWGWYVGEVEFYSCSDEVLPSDTSLTLVKQVNNDNGGSASASAWTLSAAGPSPFSGSGPSVSSGAGLTPGIYNLSENGGPTGYSASAWDCDTGTQNDADTITVVAGQVVTCTITNDDIAPTTLTVVKTIINDNGGKIIDPNAFGLRVDGSTVLHNVTNNFDAGTHTVSEDGLPDYKAGTWGGNCNPDGTITLVLGQNATCTITNDDINPFELIFEDGFE